MAHLGQRHVPVPAGPFLIVEELVNQVVDGARSETLSSLTQTGNQQSLSRMRLPPNPSTLDPS